MRRRYEWGVSADEVNKRIKEAAFLSEMQQFYTSPGDVSSEPVARVAMRRRYLEVPPPEDA